MKVSIDNRQDNANINIHKPTAFTAFLRNILQLSPIVSLIVVVSDVRRDVMSPEMQSIMSVNNKKNLIHCQ